MTRMKALLITIALGLVLSGCSGEGILSDTSNGEEEAKAAALSMEISIPIEKFSTLNPILSKNEDVYFMEKLVYDSLISLDATLAPIPAIAKTWVYSDDGKTLTFNLRNDVKWHDGYLLTAADVKFTIDALVKYQYAKPNLFSKSVANIKSVEINGNEQVVITFKTAKDNAIENFCFPIIPTHQFNGLNDVATKQREKGFIPIGTGPYKVVLSDEVQKVLLKPNDLYYGEKKASNTLIFKIIPSKQEAVNLFDIGDLMVSFSKETDREKIYGDKNVNVFPYLSNEVEVLGFNTKSEAFKDKRVRLAVASALDTPRIIEEAYYTNGVRNDSLYFPNYLGLNSSENLIIQNYEKANQLLQEAGFIDRDKDSYLEGSDGEDLTITILVNSEDASRTAAAVLIKNSLDKLPIHTVIMLKDWSGYNAALSSGDFQLFIGGWRINEKYDLRFALHSDYNNIARYSNPMVDNYLDLMQTGLSKEKKLELLTKVKAITSEDLPYYCLTYKTYAVATSKSLQGIVEPFFFNIFNECEDWSYIE